MSYLLNRTKEKAFRPTGEVRRAMPGEWAVSVNRGGEYYAIQVRDIDVKVRVILEEVSA